MDYKPYSEEWKKEISKFPKNAIIEMLATVGVQKQELLTAALKIQSELSTEGLLHESYELLEKAIETAQK